MAHEVKTSIYSYLLLISILCVPMPQRAEPQTGSLFEKIGIEASLLETDNVAIVKSYVPYATETKTWTVLLYIAADNDLSAFAIRNIKQMTKVGSNEHFNLIVQLDIRKSNGEKTTRRYYVERDKVLHLNADDPQSQAMDSGNPTTLIAFCDWAIANFPAKNFGLILWNHGTGGLDPERGRVIRPEELFTFNPITQKLDLDRSIGYMELMQQRGVCWDDTNGSYLSNPKLDAALTTICKRCLNGDKFAFIGFDACLMQMIEVANIIKKYAHVMIASEEVELGYGWDYVTALEPFNQGVVGVGDVAESIVQSFGRSYEKITSDYTLSALNLDAIEYLENNINDVAQLLIDGIKNQKDGLVKKAIKTSTNRSTCTHFDEPSYKDLYHIYSNLLINVEYAKFKDAAFENNFKTKIKTLLQDGMGLIESIVFANTTGRNLSMARGVSIYFPEQRIHPSYKRLPFAQANKWFSLLSLYQGA